MQSEGFKFVTLTEEFFKDTDWFLRFLPQFNEISYIKDNDLSMVSMVDASLSGLGAIWEKHVYACPIIPSVWHNATIVHYEMVNIIVALATWGHRRAHQKVIKYCDNEAVVLTV